MANMNVVAGNGVAGHPYFDPERSTNDTIKGYEGSYLTGPGRRELSEDEAWRERKWKSPLVPFSPGRAAMRLSGLLRTWDATRNTAQSVAAPANGILRRAASGLETAGGGGASSASPLSETILQVREDADTADLPQRKAEDVEPPQAEGTGFFEPVTSVEPNAPTAEAPMQPPTQEG